MKRGLGAIAWVVLSVSCAAPSASPVQEWAGPVRTEPDTTAAREMFDQVVDGTFSFDDEAFYWLCAHARSSAARQELLAAASESPIPIRQLLERPADFRGRPVVVEGVLRSREEYEIRTRPELGRLTQLELSVPGSRAVVTIVCTERAASMSIGLPVRATGYFLKSRQFRTTDGQPGGGIVLVTTGMISTTTSSVPEAPRRDGFFGLIRAEWIAAGITVLVVVWLYLRRRLRVPGGARHSIMEEAPTRNGAVTGDSDFAWMASHDRQEMDRTARSDDPGGPSDR